MTTKTLGGAFTPKLDKDSGRVRLVKSSGYKKNASQKIAARKSKKVRVTRTVKGFQRQ
jgi:hypothetical protein